MFAGVAPYMSVSTSAPFSSFRRASSACANAITWAGSFSACTSMQPIRAGNPP